MIVRAAQRRRLLRDDPLAGIRPLREPRAEIDPLSPEEIAAFLAACPSYWRPYFTVRLLDRRASGRAVRPQGREHRLDAGHFPH